MIHSVLIINNHGRARLTKFYDRMSENQQQQVIRDCFQAVSKRSDRLCNFLEMSSLFGQETKLIYRHYATLYFVFVVDPSESELAILDLIQVFVEALDKCFENVCELDLIFHFDRVNYIMDELIMGGMVLETSLGSILEAYDQQHKLEQAQKGGILGNIKY